MTRSVLRRPLLLPVALVLLAAAACGGDDSAATTTTTTEATSTTAAGGESAAETKRFDEEVQQELRTVGCYSGEVDGILGPESDAAIVAFQTAEGLEVDGELGPQTDTALDEAAATGKQVCDPATTTTAPASTTTTTAASGGTAPCTATAIAAALGSGEQVTSFTCAGGYAAGGWTNGQADGAFILQSESGKWVKPAQDPCDSASAGLPPVILEDGCAS